MKKQGPSLIGGVGVSVERELNFSANKFANYASNPSVNSRVVAGCQECETLNEHQIRATEIAAQCLEIEITLIWGQSKWQLNFLVFFFSFFANCCI